MSQTDTRLQQCCESVLFSHRPLCANLKHPLRATHHRTVRVPMRRIRALGAAPEAALQLQTRLQSVILLWRSVVKAKRALSSLVLRCDLRC